MRRSARNLLVAAVLLLAALFANILVGKIRLLTGTGIAAPLDGVPEFILLMASAACFVAALLILEKGGGQGKPDSGARPENRAAT